MTLFPGLFNQKLRDEHHITVGIEIIYAYHGQRRIEAVTSSPRALEGGRSTFILKNETHHWLKSNEGLAMSDVISRNAAKSRGGASRALAISNAHDPGEESDAALDFLQAEQEDFLYDSVEAPADLDIEVEEDIRFGLRCAKVDSHWLDEDRLTAEILSPRSEPGTSRRYYFNQVTAAEEHAFPIKAFDELVRKDYKVEEKGFITLGFDGSQTRDWTALMGTEIKTGFQWPIGIWVPEQLANGDWHIDEEAVDQTVEWAFSYYDVWRLNADPFWWKEYILKWQGTYNKPGRERVLSFNTTQYKKMAYALLEYKNAMAEGDMSHDGDPRFRSAIAHSHRHMQAFRDDQGEAMWTIQKERPDSDLKIDPAMAGALSWEARQRAIEAGARPRRGWSAYIPGEKAENE